MTFDEYQECANRTSKYKGVTLGFPGLTLFPPYNMPEDVRERLLISGLGLSGEAGEVADYLKKVLGHGHGYDREKHAKELGDVLWYVADQASAAGLSLQDIADRNVGKLAARYPDGFSLEKSVNRAAGDD